MAATKTRARSGSRSNGAGPAVADAARKANKPALAAGAAVAGLAGGLVVGSRLGTGTGLLVRRRSTTALAIAGAKRLGKTVVRASQTADDIHAIREQLEQANKRSPIEVVLDGLTHRPGSGKRRRGLF
jgi:uncharacterized protein YcfJ